MSEKTLPIDVLGNWYEVPVQVQLHIIAMRERLAALAALAELERAAAEPACIVESARIEGPTICRRLMWMREVGAGEKLYTTPPPAQPAPKFEAPEVDDAMADRVHRNYFLAPGVTSGAELGHQMIAAVRSELGPTLGLVEIREPTPDECERISMAYYDDEALVDRDHRHLGKDMFAAVRAVMWPKSGGL